jgi:hypothetical protein
MALKDVIQNDLSVFFSLDEFAEYIDIDGQQVLAIIGPDQFNERPRHPEELYNITDGIYQSSITIFVKSADLEKPMIGQRMRIDGKKYSVVSVSEESGVLKISVMANES